MAHTHEEHRVSRWLRNPLVVFLVIGAGAFLFGLLHGLGFAGALQERAQSSLVWMTP